MAGWQTMSSKRPRAIVADEETDRLLFPHRLGGQAAQPAKQDFAVGVRRVEQGQAGLNRNRTVVAGSRGKIDTDESRSHGAVLLDCT